MKIIADDKIPFLKGALEPFADIEYIPGQLISASHLKDADALLIRTRTRCNEDLLKNSGVKFIGTATIGHDHIDTDWCEQHGITWKNAPGCNASSVRQYITSVLINLSRRHGFSLKDKTLGVVGVGNVGSKIVQLAEMFGMRVYLCDPPRVRKEGICGFISLDGIIRECDIITFHVPLNYSGEDKTFRMIDQDLLHKVNRGTLIINTSRGEVANGNALKRALQDGRINGLVLDVWEHEPDIDIELMQMCTIATPHIAGYSTDGKAKGTEMIIHELNRYFKLGIDGWVPDNIPDPLNPEILINCEGLKIEEVINRAILHTYDVTNDDFIFRKTPVHFEKIRGEYPIRREFKAYKLKLINAGQALRNTCRKFGFQISDK
jgi:erythronate-4-phosphate dehydrogenase